MSDDTESSDERTTSGKSGWKIDLTSFSKTKIKLETIINDSQKCGELIQAYFDSKSTAFTKLPWDNDRPEYGIFPLHKFFYAPCDKDAAGAIAALDGTKFVKLTLKGKKFIDEIKTTHKEYYQKHVYTWGTKKGSFIADYDGMLHNPKKSFDALRMFGDHANATEDDSSLKAIDPKDFKKMLKKCRKWLRANQKIWSKIVSHLTLASVGVCDGVETSNGIVLLAKIMTKYGHTHAQSLAALLRVLTNITLLKTDQHTGKPETIADYFQRVQRIARDASSFPSMNVPISEPLVKVFALEGLMKSHSKYQSRVTMAYSNDLTDSLEKLTAKMQTVEGLREKNIQAEYAGTNLASASVQEARGTNGKKNQHDKSNSNNWRTAGNKKKGRRPDDSCFLRNHSGHTNKECSVQKLNALKDSGRAAKPKYDKHGDKICVFALNRIKCPFGHGCRESHKVNEARAYRAAAAASPDTDSSDERRRRRKKKAKKAKKKKKHRRRSRYESTSDSSSSSSSSSDFL